MALFEMESFGQPGISAFEYPPTSTSSLETAPGPSSETDRKFAMGKAPKRKNIRNVLSPEQLGAETLEERRREQDRQQRLNWLLASRYYGHQQESFPPYQATSSVNFYLSDNERADIAARQEVWRNFTQSEQVKNELDDVVVLSSDDEDNDQKANAKKVKKSPTDSGDDSDCICLGSDDEDAENSKGLCSGSGEGAVPAHTNDAFNVPDAEGRVLINVGHNESEQDVFLAQHLAEVIKPHQIGGLRFMYDNVVESLLKFTPNGGFGCILAHSMGLGKTFQVIAFTDIVYRYTPLKRILLIVPVNTLQNWLHEYEMWLPKSVFVRDVPPRGFEVFTMPESCKSWSARLDVIKDWHRRNGVLILGYEMFRMLANKINGLQSKRPKHNNGINGQVQKPEEEPIDFGDLAKELLNPGPDLVICDEGHRIKNFQSNTSKALNTIRTKRRIVLTGYPLQNNLMEYWCMVNFVRPNYLGSRKEFAGVFERPIKNGQCVDSTEKDVRIMRYRVHVLTNLLKGFVQRRSHALLSNTLPKKSEYVLYIRKSPIQHRLYRRFIVECTADIRDDLGSWNPLKAFAVCCKIWNHPDVLYKAFQNHVDAVDGDLDLGVSSNDQSSNGKEMNGPSCSGDYFPSADGLYQFRTKKDDQKHIDYRWAEDLFVNYVPGVIENGMKMRLALSIIENSVIRNDKILLFSQSLLTLDAVESFLSTLFVPGSGDKWKKNRSYFRLDGGTNAMERQRLIARFNNERGVHLFLISTRAGSLGINLVGANRVIVFDASFNPCHDAQAVCRVYRYGQKKETFIYRLIVDNSMEKMIFNRQLGKQGIADRVIDERSVDAALCRQDLYDLLQYSEEQDMITEDCKIDPDGIRDELLLDVCRLCLDCFSKAPVTHESLMFDRNDQELSEAEKREARRAYEKEKKLLKTNGGAIDWKRWQQPESFQRHQSVPDFGLHTQRPAIDIGPPPVRCTPVPMMLQQHVSYPQLQNGHGPNVPIWNSQIPYQQTLPSFAVPSMPAPLTSSSSFPPCKQSNVINGPPELITLSDDEA